MNFNKRILKNLINNLMLTCTALSYMYSTKLSGGKAFAAERNICELKELLLRSKRIKKLAHTRVKPNKLIKKSNL